MIFDTLKDRMNYYRDLVDYKLMPNMPILVMLDGKNFSNKIKKHFSQPFDEDFHNIMNETAKYLCENIQGCKVAFVQSDEISIFIEDTYESEPTFGLRLCKLQSIMASMATSKFNQLMFSYELKKTPGVDINSLRLYEFDCKAWNVPNKDEVYNWFYYRQIDCIRNSKLQVAHTLFSHKELNNVSCTKMVELCKEKGVDWESFEDGKKFGRVIHQISIEDSSRKKWTISEATTFNYSNFFEKWV